MATAKWLKSFGARRFGGSSSGGVGEIGASEVMGASTMPRVVSVNVPLMPVISNPVVGYFASVPGPNVIESDPLTPPPLNVMGMVEACA